MQTISNLMHKDLRLADQAIADLSDILRSSIQQLNTDKISLKEELSLTEKYLHFQQLRFQEKVSFRIDADPVLNSFPVPALLLQPLVENSIKHGFETTGQAVFLDIKIFTKLNHIVFDISDAGPGMTSQEFEQEKGTGITNLRNRLDYLQADNNHVRIHLTNQVYKKEVRLAAFYETCPHFL